ncbi:peptidase [Bacillus salipaludis]|uniref:NlpC/P60 family protein n=1 Tax=Bacillus salipaludis TaxID=2547811 RepID=A0A4R5VZX4_9BACI|nr:C40 family peptidase [Bacillus salipaludis]MDQ6596718.1 NlpC/P60 family protein [Bacillus salipaludis]TDK65059.1 peptidase [Bacillus salipaludis]
MKKKLTVLSTLVMLGFGSAYSIPAVKAAPNNDLQSIKGQRSGVQAGISKANAEVTKVQSDLARLIDQSNRVDQAIKDNNSMMAKTENNIKDSKSQVQKIEQEVAVIKKRIDTRNEILKKRAVSYQESGGTVSYLDVLLGASSFSDFIDRIGAVSTFVQADQNFIKQYEDDKKEVEVKQAAVQKKLTELKEMKTELEGMHEQILDQKKENDTLKEKLKQKEQEQLDRIAKLKGKEKQLALKEYEMIHANDVAPAPASAPVSDDKNSSDNNSNSSNSDNNSSNSSSSSNQSDSNDNTPVATHSGSSGSVQDVITAGNKYIGNSVYVFGGGRSAYDVAHGRFDCSGFVHWAFAQAGYNIGSSTDSLKYAGRQVPSSQMKPGDLVFFNTYKTDGHVGIYVGGGKFIGSQSSTGVAIASMSNSYWKSRFNGRVVRIIE